MFDKGLLTLTDIKKTMRGLVGLYILQAFLIVGQAVSLGLVITHLWSGKPLKEQFIYIIGFIISFAGREGLQWWSNRWLDDYARVEAKKLRKTLLEKVFILGPELVQKQGTGHMVTLTLDGISEVEDYIQLTLGKMISMMIVPIVVLAMAFYLDWVSGVILFFIYPLIVLFMIILGYAAKAKADKQFVSFQRLSNHFIDSLRGIDTLKYFGLSKRYANSIYKTSERFRKTTMSVLRVAILSTFALDFFTTLSIAVVAVFLGLRLINGEITLFPALTVLILSPEYFLPIRAFANDYHATLNGKNSFHSIQEIINSAEVKESKLELHQWQPTDSLKLDNIEFAYDDNAEPVKFNTEFTGYQKVGIIGMSGAGKTTLINLLSGFLPLKNGNFEIQGKETTDLNEDAWRNQIIYIPQSPYIFDNTLRYNIAFYTPDASDEEIIEAIKAVGLEDLLEELPDKLDTLIGNGQRTLSGGQAQRIALARAFLDKQRKVLIFDEPTAHLDIETELELKERMLPLMKDRLVIFATHRLHWMKDMDKIVVLKDGKIAEEGQYDELLAHQAYFYELLNRAKGGEKNV